ncbi:CHASE3 domain-containing protein [Streptomyces mobaraensis]|uniref:sensor histidine kinase n=1 Tax=Streptomyces sp. TYQ1024 TaxID=2762559 RepID=UPI001CCB6938|nr:MULTISPECIES: ATP-binding protein [Streptomyces]UBI40923.1 CHASE3 domain-containing protein [Streptomyces mobaraensis]UKW33408.1 CHASE3 domain-containing protein [Streptomyces sp. TYQ1024]
MSATLVVLTVLGAVGAWALARTASISDHLVSVRSPALVEAVRLESALVNQETGVRGYGLTGRRDFLEPYTQGLADEKAAAARLRRLVGDEPAAREDLDRVLERAEAWQARVARPVAAAQGAEAARLLERAGGGKSPFDVVRASLQEQQRHLAQERAETGDDLADTRRLRNGVFAAIAAVIVLVAVLIFEGLRRGVTTPLERLGSDARLVAQGHFTHPIAATGPADLRRLSGDVEAMRRRMVGQLEFTETARTRLDEQAAELRRSNAELEQFAYVASHDLQEPLRKVASFCQLLQRRYGDGLDERAHQYIAFAVDGANRMQVLINDLLAFSRVGRVHNDHDTVDLEAVLETTLDALSVPVEESEAEITHDPLPTVVGDRTQLGMLWQNLVSNAVKFRAPDRRPAIHVSAERDGDVWRFAVTDNGIGIGPEYTEKVFALFQRLHTREAYPGTGIGLAMCRKIVEFHGGTIAVDPEHEGGARVVFTLPAAGADDSRTTVSDGTGRPAS